eukprot:5610267-Amphidinium_carterae.1
MSSSTLTSGQLMSGTLTSGQSKKGFFGVKKSCPLISSFCEDCHTRAPETPSAPIVRVLGPHLARPYCTSVPSRLYTGIA